MCKLDPRGVKDVAFAKPIIHREIFKSLALAFQWLARFTTHRKID
jgi:hypothetical protein